MGTRFGEPLPVFIDPLSKRNEPIPLFIEPLDKEMSAFLTSAYGHFVPRKGVTYRGHVVITYVAYSATRLLPSVIDDAMGIKYSPWWRDALYGFLSSLEEDYCDVGYVTKLSLTFRNYKFWITKVESLSEPEERP